MKQEGTSKGQYGRLHETMAGYVARGEVPGLVAAVAKRGEDAHVEVFGTKALGATDPVQRDSIFRISSMTKPIAAAAAMILAEESTLRLDEPVDRFLPELAAPRVLRRIDGPLDDTVPAKRAITVRDLLTFCMGFGLVFAPPDAYPILRATTELDLATLGPPIPGSPHTPDEWMRRFGTLPLMHQPGEAWMYNTSASVLGVLIARASGRPLETFLRERIFEPLGMKDTGFSVPPAQIHRFVESYRVDPTSGGLVCSDGMVDSQWSRVPAFPDAAAGLVSTVDDYLAFGQMLLNRGTLGLTRILSPASVDAMTADQLTPAQKNADSFVPGFWNDHGWGYGLTVITGPDALSSVPGRYGWDGGLGTSFYADPHKGLLGVLLTQRGFTSPNPPDVCKDFWASVYEST